MFCNFHAFAQEYDGLENRLIEENFNYSKSEVIWPSPFSVAI